MMNEIIRPTFNGTQFEFELNRFYYDLPDETYHGLKLDGQWLLSSSVAKKLVSSIAEFLSPGFEKTSAMELGTLFHAYMQGEETFSKDYVVVDAKSKANSVYKEAVSNNPNATIVKEQDLILTKVMRKNLVAHPKYTSVCEDTKMANEVTVFYKYNGFIFKSRFDRLCFNKRHIIDWKTTVSAKSLKKLLYTCEDFGYDIQAMLYKYAYEQVTGDSCQHYLIWVEKQGLCLPRFTQIPQWQLEEAKKSLDVALFFLSMYDSNPNTYPGYSEEVEEIPYWRKEEL
jgi:hypothetical protein